MIFIKCPNRKFNFPLQFKLFICDRKKNKNLILIYRSGIIFFYTKITFTKKKKLKEKLGKIFININPLREVCHIVLSVIFLLNFYAYKIIFIFILTYMEISFIFISCVLSYFIAT